MTPTLGLRSAEKAHKRNNPPNAGPASHARACFIQEHCARPEQHRVEAKRNKQAMHVDTHDCRTCFGMAAGSVLPSTLPGTWPVTGELILPLGSSDSVCSFSDALAPTSVTLGLAAACTGTVTKVIDFQAQHKCRWNSAYSASPSTSMFLGPPQHSFSAAPASLQQWRPAAVHTPPTIFGNT